MGTVRSNTKALQREGPRHLLDRAPALDRKQDLEIKEDNNIWHCLASTSCKSLSLEVETSTPLSGTIVVIVVVLIVVVVSGGSNSINY
jgi:hypothetical protein